MPATPAQTLLENAKCFASLGLTPFEALLVAEWDAISQRAQVASFINRSGITDATQIAALNTLVVSAKVNGWWDKCDLIYPFVGGTAQAHAQNLKSSSFTITWNGTVTHNANGITGDGATGYGDTGYIPASGGQMALNSVHVGIYRRATVGANGTFFIGSTDSNANETLSISRSLVATTQRVGLNTILSFNALLTSLGWMVASRLVAATGHLFSGSSDTSSLTASEKLPASVSINILANHQGNGTTANFIAANLAGVTAGSGLTFAEYLLMASDWQTFQTSLGRQV
jgi:hypothetical protein